MTSGEVARRSSGLRDWLPRAVAIAAGIGFVLAGLWAMVEPRSFFESLARFEPFNQHFLQDIGAFQVGLGAVLLLAGALPRGDTLALALAGVGIGAALHAVSHVVGRDLGGEPARDIPVFGGMAVLLLAASALRWNRQHSDDGLTGRGAER